MNQIEQTNQISFEWHLRTARMSAASTKETSKKSALKCIARAEANEWTSLLMFVEFLKVFPETLEDGTLI